MTLFADAEGERHGGLRPEHALVRCRGSAAVRHRARVWQQLVPSGGRAVCLLRHAGHLSQPHNMPIPLQKSHSKPLFLCMGS